MVLWGSDQAGGAGVDWGQLGDWLTNTAPEDAALVAIRFVAFVLASWLLASTVAYLLARVSRVPALVAGVRWATLPGVRALVDGTVAVSILGGAFFAGPAGAQVPSPVVIELSAGAHQYTPVAAGDGAGVASAASTTTTPVADGAPAFAVAEPQPVPPTAVADTPVTAGQWAVAEGNSFWVIATSVLTDAWGRPPTDAELVPYWEHLIGVNRSRLVPPPGDPNLIFPGQVFEIPAPPPPPA